MRNRQIQLIIGFAGFPYRKVVVIILPNKEPMKVLKQNYRLLIIVFLIRSFVGQAQEIQRPAMWGIPKMTFLVSEQSLAKRYYGDFLGFAKTLSYSSPIGEVVSYKVNDRQFIEFVQDNNAKEKDRLVSVSFETENVEMMRLYLKAKRVNVPDKISVDGAGNKVFLVYDPAGVPIEFLEWGANSLHRATIGKFLSPNRISERIHHAGLFSTKLDDNPSFYTEILGFKTILRIPEDLSQAPQILYFQIPGTAEFIEHYPTETRAFSHPCFVAKDMQEVVYTLKERRKEEKLASPMVGKGRRWLLNIYNSDGTRVEFTEMFLAK